MKIFGYDSLIISFMTKISQLLIVNILWILCSIPVFTIGASSTALYAVTLNMAEKRGGNVALAFLREFKKNFRDGTKVFLLMALLVGILVLDAYVLMAYDFPGGTFAAAVTGILFILFFMVWALVFPITARYQNSARNLLKSAFLLCTQNLYKSLFMVFMNLLPFWVFLLDPDLFLKLSIFWVLLGFALIAYIDSMIILQILKKNDMH